MSSGSVRVLSPHLDDAILSCGGAVAEWTEKGRDVEIWTPFAADEPSGAPVSELVEMLHRVFELDEGIVASRREEDLRAAEIVGARSLHGPLLEGIYRTDARGAALYPDLRSLFGEVRSEDRSVEDRLVELLTGLRPVDRWLAPLGVGHHVDHLLVRRAAERAAPEVGAELRYYEDVPYVMKWRALTRTLRNRGDWAPEAVPVSPGGLDRKIRAVAAYASQVRPLFGGEAAMARKLRRFHRKRRRGERFWRRTAAEETP